MATNIKHCLVGCLIVFIVGCPETQEKQQLLQPDDSVFEEKGPEKIRDGWGRIHVGSNDKCVVHYGVGSTSEMDQKQIWEATGPGIAKVTNEAGETVLYWRHPRLVPGKAMLSPDSAFLAVGAAPRPLRLNDYEPGSFFVFDLAEKKKVFEMAIGRLHTIAYSNNGRCLAVIWSDSAWQYLSTYEAPSMREVQRLRVQNHIVNISFFDSDSKLVTCGWDGLLEVWNAEKLSICASLHLPFTRERSYGQIAWMPNRNTFLVRQTKAIHEYDPRTNKVVSTFTPHLNFTAVCPVPDTNLVLCNGHDQVEVGERVQYVVRLWDLEKSMVVHEERIDEKNPIGLDMTLMHDGQRLVYAEDDKLRIRDMGEVLPKTKEFLVRHRKRQ